MVMNKKIQILVVEDEQAIREGLIDVLVYHGYSVESAATGPEGLALALSGKFDLILLDIMLPGMDGYEICNRIRETDRDQPIIMLTAKTSDEEIVEGQLTLGLAGLDPPPDEAGHQDDEVVHDLVAVAVGPVE